MDPVLIYIVSVLAVGGLALAVGYMHGRNDRDGRGVSPAHEEVIEDATDKEVDEGVADAVPRDDDLDWLSAWPGPGPE